MQINVFISGKLKEQVKGIHYSADQGKKSCYWLRENFFPLLGQRTDIVPHGLFFWLKFFPAHFDCHTTTSL
jgi:hypothetical protein